MMSSITLWNSPELWWILFYEPVHIKAVVKLDGGKKRSHGQFREAVYKEKCLVTEFKETLMMNYIYYV